MKACYIDINGDRSVLKFGDLEKPSVPEGHALVRLKYCALNHLDVWIRNGVAALKHKFPHVLGADGFGTIESVKGQSDWKSGDSVIVHPGVSCGSCERCRGGWESLCRSYQILGEHVWGTNAQYISVPVENLFKKPAALSEPEAASVALTFTTAWQMVFPRANLREGETALVHAAASGVSTALIQLAKWKGARVIATSSSEEKLQLAKSLGADECLLLDCETLVDRIRELTSRKGVDVIFDHVGEAIWKQNIRCLAWGGRIVLCGASSGARVETDLRHVFYRQLSILGSTMGNKADFSQVLELFEGGVLKASVDQQLDLEQLALGHQWLEERRVKGKIVLRIP